MLDSARLKNIEDTEKAKRVVAEGRKDRPKVNNDEEHLAASRCRSTRFLHPLCTHSLRSVYRPNLRQKSDADILRDAKLEAMGMPAQDHEPRRNNHEKTQMATDEMVYQPYHLPLCLVNRDSTGHGTL